MKNKKKNDLGCNTNVQIEIYNKKIITAFTIETAKDVEKYKLYKDVADIYLFDSKGYEKSMSFNHSITFVLNVIPVASNGSINPALNPTAITFLKAIFSCLPHFIFK